MSSLCRTHLMRDECTYLIDKHCPLFVVLVSFWSPLSQFYMLFSFFVNISIHITISQFCHKRASYQSDFLLFKSNIGKRLHSPTGMQLNEWNVWSFWMNVTIPRKRNEGKRKTHRNNWESVYRIVWSLWNAVAIYNIYIFNLYAVWIEWIHFQTPYISNKAYQYIHVNKANEWSNHQASNL